MVDKAYLAHHALASRDGRMVDLSGISNDLDAFTASINPMMSGIIGEARRIDSFYRSDEYRDIIEEYLDDFETLDEEEWILELFMPVEEEEFYDPTPDMKNYLMYFDEMIEMKKDSLIQGFGHVYEEDEDGAIYDIDYLELHAGRTSETYEGGHFESANGGVSIEDYLFLQDIYSAYRKKLFEKDVTAKRP